MTESALTGEAERPWRERMLKMVSYECCIVVSDGFDIAVVSYVTN